MKNKTQRILLNVLQLFFMIAAIYSWDRNLMFHAFSGVTFTALTAWHLYLNKKMFITIGNFFRAGAKNSKLKWQFQVSIIASSFWSIAIIAGLLGLVSVSLTGSGEQASFVHVHGALARIGCLLVIIHAVQHYKQMKAYLKKTSGA